MARLRQIGVPDAVEICPAVEEFYSHPIASTVGEMPEMHRLMEISEEMGDHLQGQRPVIFGGCRVGKYQQLRVESTDDIARRRCLYLIKILSFVDILVMPRLGVFIFCGVGGIVKPIAPIDERHAGEQ